ncbi:MAG: cyclic nucleotide-binding domain-containing protein [Candidatus Omnitrophica bacterium]|nr:cyclic nucleotide-binding domain-containing protein [Candidatus Omnitrophota bacterium]
MSEGKVYYPVVHTEEILAILSKIAVFGGLNDRQLHEIFSLLKMLSYAPGEYVFKQGEAPSCIYIVLTGEVKIIYDIEGVTLELASFGAGDCFGETSVIGIQSHSSSALAVATSELIVLEHKALLDIFQTDKELFGLLILNIARETSRRLHRLDEVVAKYVLSKKDN